MKFKNMLLLILIILLLFSINSYASNTIDKNNIVQENKNEQNQVLNEKIEKENKNITTIANPSRIMVSIYQMLKYYLEIDDGNTYNIYLTTDITIPNAINQKGNKNLYGQGHTLKSNMNVTDISAIHVYGTMNIYNTNFNGNNLKTEASNKVSVRNGGYLKVYNSNFYGGTQGIHVDSTSTLVVESGNFYNNYMGIGAFGTVTINSGIIHNNTQGLHNNQGNFIINGVTLFNNEVGIFSTGKCMFNDGSVYENGEGLQNASGTMDIKGGNIDNNNWGISNIGLGKMTISDVTLQNCIEFGVYHCGTSCTIIGGNFNQDIIYLAGDDKYINTNSSYPTFNIRPNSYLKGRVLVKTTNNSYANNELSKVTLNPANGWSTKVSSENIVLWKKGTVNAIYVDESNKQIDTPTVINGYVDDNYTTTSKNIYGYTLISTPSNQNGKIIEGKITVTYKYKLKDAKVIVNHKDENNNILQTKTITGKVFENYKTTSEEIYGYKLKIAPSNNAGTMTEDTITVNYIYSKVYGNITVNVVDKNDNSNKLQGAKIELYDSNNTLVETQVTNSNGQALFKTLPVGIYKLVEVQAKEEYSLAKDEQTGEITNNNTEINLTFYNYKKTILPATGGILLLIEIIGIIIVTTLLIYILKKRSGGKKIEK